LDKLRNELPSPLVRDTALEELPFDLSGAHLLHFFLDTLYKLRHELPSPLVRDTDLGEFLLDLRGAHLSHFFLY